MNNYNFTNNDGKHYKRITKAQARKAYDAGKTIYLCACNLRPFGFWHPEIDININDYITRGYMAPATFADGSTENDFKYRVNNFEFYNCTNTETGRYSAFYIEF